MAVGTEENRVTDLREALVDHTDAQAILRDTSGQLEPTLDRLSYISLSLVTQERSPMISRTYGLLVEKAIINLRDPDELPNQVRIDYGGPSSIRFKGLTVLPSHGYISPIEKLNTEGLIVQSLREYVLDIDEFVFGNVGIANLSDVPYRQINAYVKEAAGNKVTANTVELWRNISDLVLDAPLYLPPQPDQTG